MHLEIQSDLTLEFEGHELTLHNDDRRLVAEFSSLRALRRLRRRLPLGPGPLPEVLRLPGIDGLTANVVVRGRTIAFLRCSKNIAAVKLAWWNLCATVLHLPGR